MRFRFLTFIFILTIFFSCKKTQDQSLVVNESIDELLTEKDLLNLDFIEFALDTKTEDKIENWEAYYELQDVIIAVKKADLDFFKDNEEGIKTLFTSLEENIPDSVNSPPTLARILALKTKLLKLESLSNLTTTSKQELSDTIKEFLESFSNLNFQMNKKIEKDNLKIIKP